MKLEQIDGKELDVDKLSDMEQKFFKKFFTIQKNLIRYLKS